MKILSLVWIILAGFGSACAKMSAEDTASSPVFLAISDIHLNEKAGEITYGADTGAPLWQRVQDKLALLIARPKNPPQFLIVLGDLPAHRLTDEARLSNDKKVLEDLETVADGAIPVFYVAGNNDGMKGNYHSFADGNGKTILSLNPDAGWPVLNGKASCQNSPQTACLLDGTHLKQGYYAAYLLGSDAHWRLIALNSVIFSAKYQPDDGVAKPKAAEEEIDWLAAQLKVARGAGDQVLLAMHIPPGFDGYANAPMWAAIPYHQITVEQAFIDLIAKYQGIIGGILSSHTHHDEIRKIYNASHQFIALDSGVPGISPVYDNNPGFKLFSYNSNDLLEDAQTYYTLPDATVWGDRRYDFAGHYGCPVHSTLFECVADIEDPQKLAQWMNENYMVRHHAVPSDWKKIDQAIDVTRN